MSEIFGNPSFLYADDTTNIGNLIELSSIQTDLSNVIT